MDGHSIFPELSGEDLAVGSQPGKQPAVPGVRFNIDVTKATAECSAGSFSKLVEPFARLG